MFLLLKCLKYIHIYVNVFYIEVVFINKTFKMLATILIVVLVQTSFANIAGNRYFRIPEVQSSYNDNVILVREIDFFRNQITKCEYAKNKYM